MDTTNAQTYPALAAATRELSDGYRASYGTNSGIAVEHRRDADVVAAVLRGLPSWWPWVRQRARHRGRLVAVDFGAGEAAKSLAVLDQLAAELPGVELHLHAVEPDPAHAAAIPWRPGLQVYQQTIQEFLAAWAAGQLRFDPAPLLAFNLHVAYYLPQRANDGLTTIPLLGDLLNLLDPDALLAVIVEGPGDLQDLKWYLHRERGLGRPAGVADVDATFATLGVGRGRPPVTIPNPDWPVEFTGPPGPMFEQLMGFLLEGNWGSRPPDVHDFTAAGRWVRRRASAQGRDRLWGPDALVVAGRWLTAHPDDRRHLDQAGLASEGRRL